MHLTCKFPPISSLFGPLMVILDFFCMNYFVAFYSSDCAYFSGISSLNWLGPLDGVNFLILSPGPIMKFLACF